MPCPPEAAVPTSAEAPALPPPPRFPNPADFRALFFPRPPLADSPAEQSEPDAAIGEAGGCAAEEPFAGADAVPPARLRDFEDTTTLPSSSSLETRSTTAPAPATGDKAAAASTMPRKSGEDDRSRCADAGSVTRSSPAACFSSAAEASDARTASASGWSSSVSEAARASAAVAVRPRFRAASPFECPSLP